MLRWGIIGSGTIAYEMAYAIRSIHNNSIEAVASRSSNKAKSFADAINISKVYTSYDELLADREINIIYIALPNHLHATVIKAGLMHNKHILCEKPFTLHPAEAEEIKVLASERNLFCMEAFWTRFIPSIEKLQSLLSEKHIGQVRMVRGSFGHVAFSKKELNPNLGEGALMDLGTYPVSLTYALFGKPHEVSNSKSINSTGADIQDSITLTYKTGMIANLACSYVSELDNDYVVYGDRGSIKLSAPMYRSARIEISYYGNHTDGPTDEPRKPSRNYFQLPSLFKYMPYFGSKIRRYLPSKAKIISIPFEGSGYQYQIKHLTDCIQKGLIESTIYPLENTVEVLRILEAARSSEFFSYSKNDSK